jgi:hypothetical protein
MLYAISVYAHGKLEYVKIKCILLINLFTLNVLIIESSSIQQSKLNMIIISTKYGLNNGDTFKSYRSNHGPLPPSLLT